MPYPCKSICKSLFSLPNSPYLQSAYAWAVLYSWRIRNERYSNFQHVANFVRYTTIYFAAQKP